MLAPGGKKTHRAYVWAYTSKPFSALKAVAYNFSPGRAGEQARINGHDPYAYLKDVLLRLPKQRASEIEQLLPHQWMPA